MPPFPQSWLDNESCHVAACLHPDRVLSRFGAGKPQLSGLSVRARHVATAASRIQIGASGRLELHPVLRPLPALAGPTGRVMRLQYAACERMFIDFAGDTVPVTDPKVGKCQTLRCSSAFLAPVATSMRRPPAARTWRHGWAPTCGHWSFMVGPSVPSCQTISSRA